MTNKNRPDSVSDQVLISLRQIIRSIDMRSKHLVKLFGLTGPQLVILQAAARTEKTTASELARASSLSQATVTGILDRLENQGLIYRQRSRRDRRRVDVFTTTAGERMIASAPSLMQESFVEQFDELPDWEQHMILGSLRRIVALTEARKRSTHPRHSKDQEEARPGKHGRLSETTQNHRKPSIKNEKN